MPDTAKIKGSVALDTSNYEAGMKLVTTQAQQFMRQRERDAQRFMKSMDKIMSVGKYALVGSAIAQSFREGFELAERAAKKSDIEATFSRLAKRLNRDADEMLADIGRSTKGALSEMQGMALATQSMMAGMSFEDVNVALTYLNRYAKATNKSFDQLVTTIMTGLARGSTLMLDDAGILIDQQSLLNQKSKEYGRALTEIEKKQILVSEAVDQMRRKMGALGGETKSTYDHMQSLKAQFQDFQDWAGKMALKAFGSVKAIILGLQLIFKSMQEITARLALAVETSFGEVLRTIRFKLMDMLMMVRDVTNKAASALSQFHNAVAQAGAKTLNAAADKINDSVVRLFDANLDSLTGTTKRRLTDLITELRGDRMEISAEMDDLKALLTGASDGQGGAEVVFDLSPSVGTTAGDTKALKAIESQRKQLEAMLAQTRLDMDVIGLDEYAAEEMRIMHETAELTKTMDASLQPLIDSYKRQALAVLETKKAYEEMQGEMEKMQAIGQEVFQSIEAPMADFFATFAESGKLAFGDFAQAFVKAITQMASQKTAMLLLEAAYEGIMGIVYEAKAAAGFAASSPEALLYSAAAKAHYAAAAAAASGAAIMGSFVAGAGLAGMAHSGIDSIPSEGTWLLDRGERVVDSDTNKDLKSYLNSKSKSYDGPLIGTVQIQNSDEQGVLKALPQLQRVVLDIVSSDIASNGQVNKTIKRYV